MAYQVIDLTGVSSGSDMEPVDDVAVVPAPPAAKLKAKVKKPKAKEVSASSGPKPTRADLEEQDKEKVSGSGRALGAYRCPEELQGCDAWAAVGSY